MSYWVREGGRRKRREPGPLHSLTVLVALLVTAACVLSLVTDVDLGVLTQLPLSRRRVYYVTSTGEVPLGQVLAVWRFGRLRVYKTVLGPSEVVEVARRALGVYSPSQHEVSVMESPYTVFTSAGEVKTDVKQWHRRTDRWTGSGIVVCVIDTGIDYLHPDFFRSDGSSVIRALVSMFYISHDETYLVWIPGVNGTLEEAWRLEQELYNTYGIYAWMDDNGHGTHVAGIIASQGNMGYRGLAPGVSLVVVRAFDRLGVASMDTVLEALEWVYNNTSRFKIRVVNLSWGSPGDNRGLDPVSLVIDYMTDTLGIVFVAAAGNSGNMPFTINIPACARRAIAVGAFDPAAMKLAEFSSFGTTVDLRLKPDFIAAGVDIISCKPVTVKSYIEQHYPEVVYNKYYMVLSGTSMAAPCVSAVAAAYAEMLLAHATKPTYTVLLETLVENTVRLNKVGKDFVSGWGAPVIRA